MQFCTFIHEDTRRLGLLQSEHVIDLDGSQPNAVFRSMETLIAAGDDGLAVVHALLNKTAQLRRVPLQDLILAAPLQPSTVLCAGSNYRAHNAEKANAPLSGKEPEFFLKTSDCVIGPNDGIIYDPILTPKIGLRNRVGNRHWTTRTAHLRRECALPRVWLHSGK